jgi:lysophospholipase L1-like esterase
MKFFCLFLLFLVSGISSSSASSWQPPRILAVGSSMLIGRMNNCMADRLQSYGYEANVAGFCGLSTKGLSNGGKYPCPYAKFTGKSLVKEVKKALPYRKKIRNGAGYNHNGVALKTRKGKLLINHLIDKLKPDHVVFYLGGNEAGYKRKRSLKTAEQRAKYRKKLHAYIHADTLLGKVKSDVPCTWITGTWVSKVSKGYGKTNEEAVEVGKVLSEEAGERCHMILGTKMMAKNEVHTSDGLHLGPKTSCQFGERVADRLNQHIVLNHLAGLYDDVWQSDYLPDYSIASLIKPALTTARLIKPTAVYFEAEQTLLLAEEASASVDSEAKASPIKQVDVPTVPSETTELAAVNTETEALPIKPVDSVTGKSVTTEGKDVDIETGTVAAKEATLQDVSDGNRQAEVSDVVSVDKMARGEEAVEKVSVEETIVQTGLPEALPTIKPKKLLSKPIVVASTPVLPRAKPYLPAAKPVLSVAPLTQTLEGPADETSVVRRIERTDYSDRGGN